MDDSPENETVYANPHSLKDLVRRAGLEDHDVDVVLTPGKYVLGVVVLELPANVSLLAQEGAVLTGR